MDDKTSKAYNALQSMMFDGTKKPMRLPLSLLEAITNNFSDERILGRGGFAVVYKGMLGDAQVAVKKLSETNDFDEKRFSREILCLMKSQHKNVMRFLGYCADTQGEMADFAGKNVFADRRERLLCFEFVPGGSLEKYIADPSCGLEWRARYQIIRGICEGLHYLHEENIVHRDLKPANILLDYNKLPKIADFGISQCFDQGQSSATATNLMGSGGYLPPEFYDDEKPRITFKLDIYSLGVIINEILTGGRAFSTEEVVIESWDSELETPERDIQLNQIRACCAIAKMCMDHDRANRPTTHRIIEMFKELGGVDKFDEAGASTPLTAQMDDKTSTTYNILERILLDEREKPTKLPLSLLKTITDNFSEEREIARGAFGVVYKGTLANGMVVAVKKLPKRLDMHGEFNREVQCLLKVQHRNIVRFLGYYYCTGAQGETANLRKRLLCFEFVPNGSLDEYITDASCGLEWRMRYQIIKGISEGLHHLHEKRIVHLDLKPANILLHDNMLPKIADFGLSRCLEKESKTVTSQIIGSRGYLAPEFYTGEITFELDIYSLGVMIMEILIGEKRRPTVKDVLKSWNNRLDVSQGDTSSCQVRACAEIGRMCTDPIRENRPTTRDIIKRFEELGISDGFKAAASSSVAQLIGLRKPRGGQKGTQAPGTRIRYELIAEKTGLQQFSFKDIIRATNNFDPSHCLGGGRFAKAYKGTFRLTNGHDADLVVQKNVDRYRAERLLRSWTHNHRNVLRLVGFCSNSTNFYACYELCSKGPLHMYFDDGSTNNQRELLTWSTRYQIICGICAGLSYLYGFYNDAISHMELEPREILLDDQMIKPRKILLDVQMTPKLADFGVPHPYYVQGNVDTTTTGYMAPEFEEDGIVARSKRGIYSLGVLIMATVMGKEPKARDRYGVRFIERIRSKFIFEEATATTSKKCRARDPAQLKKEASWLGVDCLDDVEKCIGLAFDCVDPDPDKRPLITDICRLLPVVTASTSADSHVAIQVMNQAE